MDQSKKKNVGAVTVTENHRTLNLSSFPFKKIYQTFLMKLITRKYQKLNVCSFTRKALGY